MKGQDYQTGRGLPVPGEGFADFFYNKETGHFEIR